MCETSGILPHYFHTMELSEILHRINRAIGRFEREAVEAAMLRQDEITPELLRSVRYARHRESGTISQIRTCGELRTNPAGILLGLITSDAGPLTFRSNAAPPRQLLSMRRNPVVHTGFNPTHGRPPISRAQPGPETAQFLPHLIHRRRAGILSSGRIDRPRLPVCLLAG